MKKRNIVKLISIGLILFAIVLWTENALACSCVEQPEDDMEGVWWAFEEADIVFLGHVNSVSPVSSKKPEEKEEIEDTIFSVLRLWKGEQTSFVITRINVQCCVCGMKFEVNADYLIYGYKTDEEGFYSTSICDRSGPKKWAARDIEILDANVIDLNWTGPIPPKRMPVLATEEDSIESIIEKLGCAICHKIPTIEGAKKGVLGPLLIAGSNAGQRLSSLEYQSAIQAGKANAITEKEYIIESILNPNAFIVPGFPSSKDKSIMPQNYEEKITEGALSKLADFLLSLDIESAKKEGLDRNPMEKEGTLYPK